MDQALRFAFCVFAALVGLLGLFIAAGARDNAISYFGLSLAVFGALFNFWIIKRHFDTLPRPESGAAE
jgi:ABC-type maltose transport system permease subunit